MTRRVWDNPGRLIIILAPRWRTPDPKHGTARHGQPTAPQINEPQLQWTYSIYIVSCVSTKTFRKKYLAGVIQSLEHQASCRRTGGGWWILRIAWGLLFNGLNCQSVPRILEKSKVFSKKSCLSCLSFHFDTVQRHCFIGGAKEENDASQGDLVSLIYPNLTKKSKLSRSLSERTLQGMSGASNSVDVKNSPERCCRVFYRLYPHACRLWRPQHSKERAKPRGDKVRPAEERIKTQQKENDSAAEAVRQRPKFFSPALFLSLPLSRDEH